MHLIERPLFRSELLAIRHAVARPTEAECSDLAWAEADLVILPFAGLFALHDAPRRHFIANPNHALFLGRGQPYRMSFPGRIGDESIVLAFSPAALADMLAETVGLQALCSPRLRPNCLLSAENVLERSLLWREMMSASPDPLAVEERSVAVMEAVLRGAASNGHAAPSPGRALTHARRRRQVEDVKEAITLFPTQPWTLAALASVANTSQYHLARVFREEVGLPVHQYLLRTRLGKVMEAMHETGMGLTDIALDAGFASHSHLTAAFRAHFGMAPAEFRRTVLR
ncbi:helix-turn-helix transcriptional regulator [Noviherbaspirillum sp. ST9]|uniref:AraC family transcriptional regulator n=1 Tax=Noviherbaspirillum sp. ST9 TaxID=3401606 RepID=UPI003B58A2A8